LLVFILSWKIFLNSLLWSSAFFICLPYKVPWPLRRGFCMCSWRPRDSSLIGLSDRERLPLCSIRLSVVVHCLLCLGYQLELIILSAAGPE
jgi:hypothetical protein